MGRDGCAWWRTLLSYSMGGLGRWAVERVVEGSYTACPLRRGRQTGFSFCETFGLDGTCSALDRTPPTAHISLRTVILQDSFDFLTS